VTATKQKKIKAITTKDLGIILDLIAAQRRMLAIQGGEEREWHRAKLENRIVKSYVGLESLEFLTDEVNGAASAHTYTSDDIMMIIRNCEEQLRRHNVPLTARKGVKITALSGVPTAKAYAQKSRSAIATRVYLERTSGAWYVTKVERAERWTGPGGAEEVAWDLPEDAKQAILKNAMKDF